jgi:hypothetical protein
VVGARRIARSTWLDATAGASTIRRQLGIELNGTDVIGATCRSIFARRPPSLDNYVPTSRPGSRATHMRLSDGRFLYHLLGPDFTLLRMVRNGSPRASWKMRRESGAFRIIPSPRLRQSRQPHVGRGRGVTCVACCASGEGRRRCGAGRGVPLLVAAAANRKLRHQLTARPETFTLTVTTTMRNLTTTAIRIAISMMIISRAGGVRAELP